MRKGGQCEMHRPPYERKSGITEAEAEAEAEAAPRELTTIALHNYCVRLCRFSHGIRNFGVVGQLGIGYLAPTTPFFYYDSTLQIYCQVIYIL